MTETENTALEFDVERCKWREVPKDLMPIYQKVVDTKKYYACLGGARADCWEQSMLLYLCLEKTGVRRMRGKRHTEREYGGWHYWVENDTLVYEEHGGVRQIFNKDAFYKVTEITDAEQSSINLFFRDEFEGKDKMTKDILRRLRDGDPATMPTRIHIVKSLIDKNKKVYGY